MKYSVWSRSPSSLVVRSVSIRPRFLLIITRSREIPASMSHCRVASIVNSDGANIDPTSCAVKCFPYLAEVGSALCKVRGALAWPMSRLTFPSRDRDHSEDCSEKVQSGQADAYQKQADFSEPSQKIVHASHEQHVEHALLEESIE